ncbi:unnamed protein product, partial [Phaeothamnion confervicola]
MKFGKSLSRRLPPEALSESIDYKALKTLLTRRRGGGRSSSSTGNEFCRRLQFEKAKVARHYAGRERWCFAAIQRLQTVVLRLACRNSVGGGGGAAGTIMKAHSLHDDPEAFAAHAGALVDAGLLLREARELARFVEVNRDAFCKILKKRAKWESERAASAAAATGNPAAAAAAAAAAATAAAAAVATTTTVAAVVARGPSG